MPVGVESPRRRRALGSQASALIADSSVGATIGRMDIVESSASAAEIRAHLDRLSAEWRQAESAGLAVLGPYMADLAAEIAACRAAFVATSVSEIALLRAELSGIQVG
jgi:hypothetical protein